MRHLLVLYPYKLIITIQDTKIKARNGIYLTAKEACHFISIILNLYSNPKIVAVIITTY